MMMMMTHGQQWAACARSFLPARTMCFLSCPPSSTHIIPPFTSAFFRSRQQQQVLSAAAQQSAETDKHIHRSSIRTWHSSAPSPAPFLLLPFPLPLPLSLLPSPSPSPFPYPHPRPPTAYTHDFDPRSPFTPCIGTVVYLPGRTTYHVPAPFSEMIYWLPSPLRLKDRAPCSCAFFAFLPQPLIGGHCILPSPTHTTQDCTIQHSKQQHAVAHCIHFSPQKLSRSPVESVATM
ncbi:hypothetical protein HYPSUDRAFT_867502 [Hypholoma sublateritium FD-334 SS-4]|uniref:Uncharacterized protein n=1 Tax=Hypholoma sublateritium (strain FD-334 SS-4) TaxID=945553 RepID=A0A0D2LJ61_HYPSF|nr:hypothetical protein HYPSUDRAFT_867502 [Hypholoma sublateritium FD-334 SS-4]